MKVPSSEIPQRRIAYFIPNIFTAFNMATGLMSIILSYRGAYREACLLLILGGVFDMVDGRLARLTGTSSSFGEQFDSLSDLVSFGMAPALIMYNRFLSPLDDLGIIIAFLYLLCGALRLARFNVNHDKVHPNYFQGIPIPGSAMAQVGLILFSMLFPGKDSLFRDIAPFYMVFYSILMISSIPFLSFKSSNWAKKHKKQALILLIFLSSLLFTKVRVFLFLFTNIYVISGLIYFVLNRRKFDGVFNWKQDDQDEEIHV